MTIAPGTRLGPYEVAAFVGEGGMGKVYRASDTNLKRSVAIKVLPDAFASDPDRLARFQREAEVLGRLNHSNIAQIYGLEESERARCIVMELVEGETLAQRLTRGPLSLDDVLSIGKQLCDALDAALVAATHCSRLGAMAEMATLLRRALELWDRVPEAATRAGRTRDSVLFEALNALVMADDPTGLELLDAELSRTDADDDPLRNLCLQM